MPVFETEAVPNFMPFGHAPNAILLPDGEIFLVWYCGSYEGSEDQRIAGAVLKPGEQWTSPHIVANRFSHDGDIWIPEIGVPVNTQMGQNRLFFWACPLSSFRLIQNPKLLRIWGGSGGGSFFSVHTAQLDDPVWTRSISASTIFVGELGANLCIESFEPFTGERGLVLMGAARQLQNGNWLLPYHTERKDCWFHSRFFVSDTKQEEWKSVGDIYAKPGCLEPVAVQLSSGEILCYMRRGGYDGHIWRAVSSDGGRTFSEPKATNLRNPHAGIDVCLSTTTDRILLAYNDSYQQRTPLCVGISDDNGVTFRVRDIESTLGIFGYPKLLQDRDGLWHLFYSRDYHHIQHAWFDETWLEGGRRVIG